MRALGRLRRHEDHEIYDVRIKRKWRGWLETTFVDMYGVGPEGAYEYLEELYPNALEIEVYPND